MDSFNTNALDELLQSVQNGIFPKPDFSNIKKPNEPNSKPNYSVTEPDCGNSEPNYSVTYSDLKLDIQTTVKKFIPNLNVDDIIIEPSDEYEYKANVRINYTITDDIFSESDFIIISL